MSFPPHLLDELARVFARVALDQLLKESAARRPRVDDSSGDTGPAEPKSTGENAVDSGKADG